MPNKEGPSGTICKLGIQLENNYYYTITAIISFSYNHNYEYKLPSCLV